MRPWTMMNDKQKKIWTWLEALGHPEKGKKIVHLVGTNGKGSTGTFIAAILNTLSDRVGHFTSPHVLRYNERIRINLEPVSDADLAGADLRIRALRDRFGLDELFYFERSLIEALILFEEMDWLVMEAGVGGKNDITNVLTADYTVISPISMDHMDKLGYSLEEIAAQKAEVITAGRPVISSFQRPEVAAVLDRFARGRNSEIRYLQPDQIRRTAIFSEGLSLKKSPAEDDRGILKRRPVMRYSWAGSPESALAGEYESQLVGDHQLENLGVAMLFAERLGLSDRAGVRQAIKKATIPGRMQLIWDQPQIWIDGAHNDRAVEVLLQNFDLLAIDKPVLIFGMHKGKISSGMQKRLFSAASACYFVEVEGKSDEEIREAVSDRLRSLFKEGNRKPVLICGSLYILGAANDYLMSRSTVEEEGTNFAHERE